MAQKKNKMKQEIFKDYAQKVAMLFSITEEQLFTKTKRRNVVDARHLLYYLCFHRPMQIRTIQDYLNGEGYSIGHSTIIYGIDQVDDKVKHDDDYMRIAKDLA